MFSSQLQYQYQIEEPYLTGCLGAAVMDILDCKEVEAGIATGAGVPPAGAPVSTFVLPTYSLPNITIILFCAVCNYQCLIFNLTNTRISLPLALDTTTMSSSSLLLIIWGKLKIIEV